MSFDLFSCVFEHDFSDHLKCLHRFQIISLLESKRTVVQVVRVKYGDSSEIDTESHSTNTFFSSFSHCFWNSACLSLMVWTLEMLRIAYKHKFSDEHTLDTKATVLSVQRRMIPFFPLARRCFSHNEIYPFSKKSNPCSFRSLRSFISEGNAQVLV